MADYPEQTTPAKPPTLSMWLVTVRVVLIAMLAWALVPSNPGWYHDLLQWTVLVLALHLAGAAYRARRGYWLLIFVLMAWTFNPIVGLQIGRAAWSVVEMISVVLIALSLGRWWCSDPQLPERVGRIKPKRFMFVRRTLLALVLAMIIFVGFILSFPIATLSSLEKVDDFPLYVMHYRGDYFFDVFAEQGIDWGPYRKFYEAVNPDACTSFAARNADGDVIFGRNLDWLHRSSLLLYTDPPGGYASVSMVDLYYFGLDGLQEIGWPDRMVLLGTPYATIDGMNECGVAVGVNAVPERPVPEDPNRPTLLQSQILRLVLDHAANVDEAIELLKQYNVEFLLPGHIHIADASGGSAVVEYTRDGLTIVRDDKPWQVSTNYLLGELPQPECWRYDATQEVLGQAQGKLPDDQAMDLLKRVSQDHTVWSVVYNLSKGRIQIALGRDYDQVHTFDLKMAKGQKENSTVTQD